MVRRKVHSQRPPKDQGTESSGPRLSVQEMINALARRHPAVHSDVGPVAVAIALLTGMAMSEAIDEFVHPDLRNAAREAAKTAIKKHMVSQMGK